MRLSKMLIGFGGARASGRKGAFGRAGIFGDRAAPGALAALALLLATPAGAHHSYAATYDVAKTVRLEGQLVRFEFRSPHSYLHLMVENEAGETQRWAVEWAAPTALVRQGVSRDTLRTGDELIVTARPSRVQGEFRTLMLTLERPADGLTWGTNPDEVVD